MQLDTDLLDIREAAELLRVSPTSLRRWTNAGRLPCLRIGGRRERRFRRADLLAFVASGADTPPHPGRNHFCDLYTSDVDQVRAAAALLRVGLESGALCLLAARKPVQRAVLAQLGHDRPSVRADVKARRLVVGEYCASGPAQLAYWNARMRAAVTRGVSSLYVVGDLSAGFRRLPFAATLAYEAEYGRSIARAFPVTTLCQYDARKISGLDAARLMQCHDGPRPPCLSLAALAG
jgi:transcriptional repressor of dcmA and dcmR